MKKIINKCLARLGLMTIPKNIGDDLVIKWVVIHKKKYYGFLIRHNIEDLKTISRNVSYISSHIDFILKDCNIIPRITGRQN